MLTSICPKLPMRIKQVTKEYYVDLLGFSIVGDYDDYLLVKKEGVEIHFFVFKELNPLENYGQVYIRTSNISGLYLDLQNRNVPIHPNGHLEGKPWGQMEFSLLDPDHNLLTFGEGVL
jgi:hypothetical protein